MPLDPIGDIDAEVIKAKLVEKVEAQLEQMVGMLEAMQATLDAVSATAGATRIHR